MAHFRRREIDLPDPVDPAVTPVLDAARDTTGAVDTLALERVLAAYRGAAPLPGGWRDRTALHQLHPLLVHAELFGPSYGRDAVDAARGYLD